MIRRPGALVVDVIFNNKSYVLCPHQTWPEAALFGEGDGAACRPCCEQVRKNPNRRLSLLLR